MAVYEGTLAEVRARFQSYAADPEWWVVMAVCREAATDAVADLANRYCPRPQDGSVNPRFGADLLVRPDYVVQIVYFSKSDVPAEVIRDTFELDAPAELVERQRHIMVCYEAGDQDRLLDILAVLNRSAG